MRVDERGRGACGGYCIGGKILGLKNAMLCSLFCGGAAFLHPPGSRKSIKDLELDLA